MNLQKLTSQVVDKSTFSDLDGYIAFCGDFLAHIAETGNIQADIVSKNEPQYHFLQYKQDGDYQVTRPYNSDLLLQGGAFEASAKNFLDILKSARTIDAPNSAVRQVLNKVTYTLQQAIGLALDALPAGKANKARKLNGDLFERLVRLILNEMGVSCRSGVVQIPVVVRGRQKFTMSYQHDLIVEMEHQIKLIGSVKTSSKDRLDKIFIDKFLYNKLTETAVPHIAVFLNDVQRKKTSKEGQYGTNPTFLPGHFKGYTVKLNPLDGVYYCDIHKNMKTEKILRKQIQTFDCLLLNDIWRLIK